MHYSKFLDLLVCPQSREPLTLSEGGQTLRTASGTTYPIINDIPLLLTDEDRAAVGDILVDSGAGMVEEYEALRKPKTEGNAIAGNDASQTDETPLPLPGSELFPPILLPEKRIDDIYHRKGDNTRILSIGGGPQRNHPHEINLNLAPFPEVDLVGNAWRLPFRDGSVDGVWCNAVLEHVTDPKLTAREIMRVLEPGGCAIILVPFVFPVHAYPLDCQRYTVQGLKYLFDDLTIIDSGQAVGPSFAMLQLLETYLDNTGQRTLPRWLRGLVRRTLVPALRRSCREKTDITGCPEDATMPSIVYCIARKDA